MSAGDRSSVVEAVTNSKIGDGAKTIILNNSFNDNHSVLSIDGQRFKDCNHSGILLNHFVLKSSNTWVSSMAGFIVNIIGNPAHGKTFVIIDIRIGAFIQISIKSRCYQNRMNIPISSVFNGCNTPAFGNKVTIPTKG